jgi:hypothetical protein
MHVLTLLLALRDRLSSERGGFEIASSMALAAFAIVAAGIIFLALSGAGEAIVQWMQTQITDGSLG